MERNVVGEGWKGEPSYRMEREPWRRHWTLTRYMIQPVWEHI
jgi:hypothetical protein